MNWDFNGFLSGLGLLRTLATGSELGFRWISFNFGDGWVSLERSLPVVNWDFIGFLSGLGLLRTLATGSELGFQWISFNFWDF